MICTHCHTALPDSAVYCCACGRKQGSAPAGRRRHRRPQSQGTITKLPGRRKPYWARLPAAYDGTTVTRQSLGCYATHAEAAEALGRAMYAPNTSNEHSTTLQGLYDTFVNSHYYAALSPSAQGSHRSAWAHLKACSNTPVSTINKETFQKIIDRLHLEGLRRETLGKVKNLSSLLCREAMGRGLMTVNYAQLVQLPKFDSIPARPFSSSDLKLLWSASDANDASAMVTLVLTYTGMRPSELLQADIEKHLHISGRYWYFQTGSKTEAGRNRLTPIPPVIRPLITALVDGRTSGPVVSSPNGKHYRLDNWRPRNFIPLMARLGLEGYTPYSCRHTFADLQKRRQVDPEIMMRIMGHADYSTTVERYHTTTDDDIERICSAVDNMSRPA